MSEPVAIDCTTGRPIPVDPNDPVLSRPEAYAPPPAAPNALTIAHTLVQAVTAAADFDAAKSNLEQVAASLPPAPAADPLEGG